MMKSTKVLVSLGVSLIIGYCLNNKHFRRFTAGHTDLLENLNEKRIDYDRRQ
jgi:hypothetical protein